MSIIFITSCYEDPVAVYQYPIKNFFITFETKQTEVEIVGYNACVETELRIVPEHVDSLKYGTFAGYLIVQKFDNYNWKDFKTLNNTFFVGDLELNTTYNETICLAETGTFRILLPINLKQTKMDTLISNSFEIKSYTNLSAEASIYQESGSSTIEIAFTNNYETSISLKYFRTHDCYDFPCRFFIIENDTEKQLFWNNEQNLWQTDSITDTSECCGDDLIIKIERDKSHTAFLSCGFPEQKILCKFDYFIGENSSLVKTLIAEFNYKKPSVN